MYRVCGGIFVRNKDHLAASESTCGGKAPSVIADKDVDYTVTYTAALGKATATVKATVAYNAQTGAKYRIVCKPASGKSKTVLTSATKKTVAGLKAGTYKVYVRAYAKIGGTTYYGSYATKSVRVK